MALSPDILVVDDELPILTLLHIILKTRGDRSIFALDLAQARALWPQHSKHIKLVITDFGLPDGFGTDLALHVLSQSPHVRVIIMSGFSTESMSLSPEFSRRTLFLEKPFSAHTLRELLNSCLSDPLSAT